MYQSNDANNIIPNITEVLPQSIVQSTQNNTTTQEPQKETPSEQAKNEPKVDLQVILERKYTCVQYVMERVLNKYELSNMFGVNKKVSKLAINQLRKMIKTEAQNIEEKLKVLKEVFGNLI